MHSQTAPVQASASPLANVVLEVVQGAAVRQRLARWQAELGAAAHPARDLRWLAVLERSLGHEPFVIEAREGRANTGDHAAAAREGRANTGDHAAAARAGQANTGDHAAAARAGDELVGLLPLALVRGPLFGRFLVSLPYVNTAGLHARDEGVARALVDRAVLLAKETRVRFLELRHERETPHPALSQSVASKVHMRLPLPATAGELWSSFKSKLRSQIKSGQKNEFEVLWGGLERLDAFYAVFGRNMRDLGTPVFPRSLFSAALREFGEQAELCVLNLAGRPVAGALLMHGRGVTEVPSASSLRECNSTNANMVMYWNLLSRAVERGQQCFDFGRGTVEGNTYKFKKQWGAEPSPAIWQYHVRQGGIEAARPENEKFRLAIRAWQRLPVWLANRLGPFIVRGIP